MASRRVSRFRQLSLAMVWGCLTWLGVLLPSQVSAAEVAEVEDYTPTTERRGGFVFGISPIYGVGRVWGFPNEADKIGRSEFRANTGAAFAGASSIWLGGALRDWFTFGLGVHSLAAEGNDLTAQGGAFGVRLEIFPAYLRGGAWRDLGVSTEFGAGAMTTKNGDGSKVADGGSLSVLNVGAFFDPLRLWQFKLGPALTYSHWFSQSMNSHFVGLGLRTSFYGTLIDDREPMRSGSLR